MWLKRCIHACERNYNNYWSRSIWCRKTIRWNKGVIFINCAPFTDCINEINYNQLDNAKDVDAVLLMYNLREYSDNYSKTSGNLWQYYRDEPNDTSVIMILQ